MAEIMAASGDVSDMVSITVMDPDAVEDGDDGEEVPDEDEEIEYVEWEGVRVERGKLILSIVTTSLPLRTCITENATIGLCALPPRGTERLD